MAGKRQDAIGIFDSGVGGLTVANAIRKHLPDERLVYFGDTAHLPYGDKSADVIKFYSLKIAKLLIDMDCKLIVIACNSASAAAYNVLLDFFKKKAIFINVIDPLVQTVAAKNYQKVGVIATKVTTRSNVYKDKLHLLSPELEVAQLATPLLIPMIEEGFSNNNISKSIIENYLSNDCFDGIESLLLACTHFPLIKEEISQYFDHKVDVMDSTDVVANEVQRILKKNDLLSDKLVGKHQFLVSDYTKSFTDTTQMFYGDKIEPEEIAMW